MILIKIKEKQLFLLASYELFLKLKNISITYFARQFRRRNRNIPFIISLSFFERMQFGYLTKN